MELDCEGCAGCCIDWRPLASDATAPEQRGPRRPLDDTYNLVPLSRDEIAAFVDDGLGDALTPRLFEPADGDDAVRVDGREVAAVGDRPVFVVGLRKPPKPVAPFGTEPNWLPTCVFLDPGTLQCRIHGDDRYPEACATYPGTNLQLGRETECERVEADFGGERLLDDEPPADGPGPLFGPAAVGSKVFAHPDPAELTGVVDRLVASTLTADDRARFVGPAVGSRPGSFEVNAERAARAADAVRRADSWAGHVADEWSERRPGTGESTRRRTEEGASADPTPGSAADREAACGAPETPGWEATDSPLENP